MTFISIVLDRVGSGLIFYSISFSTDKQKIIVVLRFHSSAIRASLKRSVFCQSRLALIIDFGE